MTTKAPKPNCWDCIHVSDVPGSAHKSCNHPKSGLRLSSPAHLVLQRLGKRAGNIPTEPNALGVRGNPQGVRNGWFNWPYNFDPTWLESCNGFEPRTSRGNGEDSGEVEEAS